MHPTVAYPQGSSVCTQKNVLVSFLVVDSPNLQRDVDIPVVRQRVKRPADDGGQAMDNRRVRALRHNLRREQGVLGIKPYPLMRINVPATTMASATQTIQTLGISDSARPVPSAFDMGVYPTPSLRQERISISA